MVTGARSRLASFLLTIFAVATLVFWIMNLIPGGPFSELEGGRALTPEVKRQIEKQYGLDKPLWFQYLTYLRNLLSGDLGRSLLDWAPVSDLILQGASVSILLGASSLVASITIGISLGLAAAMRRDTFIDHLATTVSVAAISLPGFVFALIMMVVFGVLLRILPASGWGTWKEAILPIAALSIEPIALFSRYTRSSMLDVLGEPYIVVARSKGLFERVIILKHALRNALMPVVTVIGIVVPRLLVGSFIIETMFAIPGTGRLFVTAILRRDYPIIMAMAILYTTLVTLSNLLVDLTYGYLDPRIRYGRGAA